MARNAGFEYSAIAAASSGPTPARGLTTTGSGAALSMREAGIRKRCAAPDSSGCSASAKHVAQPMAEQTITNIFVCLRITRSEPPYDAICSPATSAGKIRTSTIKIHLSRMRWFTREKIEVDRVACLSIRVAERRKTFVGRALRLPAARLPIHISTRQGRPATACPTTPIYISALRSKKICRFE